MNENALLDQLEVLVAGSESSQNDADPPHDTDNDSHLPTAAPNQPAFAGERLLVAWLLLLKLPVQELEEAWGEHKDVLLQYATRLLTVDDDNMEESPPQKRLFVCYLRLIAQVGMRLEFMSSGHQTVLLQSVMDAWEYVVYHWSKEKLITSTHKLNIDVVSSLFLVLAQVQEGCKIADILARIWAIYSLPQTDDTSGNKDSKHEETKADDRDAVQMAQVLETWLDGKPSASSTDGNGSSGGSNNDYSTMQWHQLILNIFITQQDQVTEHLASQILFWIAAKKQPDGRFPSEIQYDWHRWLMQRCLGDGVGRDRKPKGHTVLLQDPDAMDAMQTILLAHAVSPDKDALRSEAWQTVARIAQQYGWKWSSQSSTSAPICTWTRLASGEWKIQLEKGPSISDEDRSILDGCATVMINVVEFLLDSEDRPDQVLSLEPSALLHIKGSLDEAFSVTSEYIALNEYDSDDKLVKELWCQLLPELDLETMQGLDTTISVFQKILKSSKEVDAIILRPLVHVLSSVEDTNTRMYRMARPLESSIISYLERCWNESSSTQYLVTEEDLSWACCASDLALEVFSSEQHPQCIASAMIDFIRRSLDVIGNLAPPEMIKARANLQLVLESFPQLQHTSLKEEQIQVILKASSMCGIKG